MLFTKLKLKVTTYMIANIEWSEFQEDQTKLQELEKEMDEKFEALYTPGMEQEDIGRLFWQIQVGVESGDTQKTVVERIHQLTEEIEKAREKVAKGVIRMKEIIRYTDPE